MTKLKLSKGFYQVELDEEAQAKTAFVSPAGKFQFTRMPFGLRNALAIFQRLIDVVLVEMEQYSVPYIDDILVFSESWEGHLQHIEGVLARLMVAGLGHGDLFGEQTASHLDTPGSV